MKRVIELKPCPFCGGKAAVKQFANPKNFYLIECSTCKCRTDGYQSKIDNKDEENIQINADVWNRRVK